MFGLSSVSYLMLTWSVYSAWSTQHRTFIVYVSNSPPSIRFSTHLNSLLFHSYYPSNIQVQNASFTIIGIAETRQHSRVDCDCLLKSKNDQVKPENIVKLKR